MLPILALSEGGIGQIWAKLTLSLGGLGSFLTMLALSEGGIGPIRAKLALCAYTSNQSRTISGNLCSWKKRKYQDIRNTTDGRNVLGTLSIANNQGTVVPGKPVIPSNQEHNLWMKCSWNAVDC